MQHHSEEAFVSFTSIWNILKLVSGEGAIQYKVQSMTMTNVIGLEISDRAFYGIRPQASTFEPGLKVVLQGST